MKDDEQGPIENLLEGLDQHTDALSSDELKAELKDRGIDLDAALKKAEMTIAAYDKEDRLSWIEARARLPWHLERRISSRSKIWRRFWIHTRN